MFCMVRFRKVYSHNPSDLQVSVLSKAEGRPQSCVKETKKIYLRVKIIGFTMIPQKGTLLQTVRSSGASIANAPYVCGFP